MSNWNTINWTKTVFNAWLNYAQDAGWSMTYWYPPTPNIYGLAHISFMAGGSNILTFGTYTSATVVVSLSAYQFREKERHVRVDVILGDSGTSWRIEDAQQVLRPVAALLRSDCKVLQRGTNTFDAVGNRY